MAQGPASATRDLIHGCFSFLTASKLKAEITRQRDEIARLHQTHDAEIALKQQAEKLAETNAEKSHALTKANDGLKTKIDELEKGQVSRMLSNGIGDGSPRAVQAAQVSMRLCG